MPADSTLQMFRGRYSSIIHVMPTRNVQNIRCCAGRQCMVPVSFTCNTLQEKSLTLSFNSLGMGEWVASTKRTWRQPFPTL